MADVQSMTLQERMITVLNAEHTLTYGPHDLTLQEACNKWLIETGTINGVDYSSIGLNKYSAKEALSIIRHKDTMMSESLTELIHELGPYYPIHEYTGQEALNKKNAMLVPYSLSFDGSDDYVSLASETDIAGDWSVSSWVKPTNVGYRAIIASSKSTQTTVAFSGTDDILVRLEKASGTSYWYSNWDPGFADWSTTEWFHLVVTKTGTTLTPYLNGVAGTAGTLNGSDGVLKVDAIGGMKADVTLEYKFIGKIDEVSVFNKVLTQAEITSLYAANPQNAGDAVGITNLVGYWKMDHGSGTVARDVSAAETLGSDLASSLTWVSDATNPLETLTSSGNEVTEAANTTGWGIAATTGFTLTAGVVYKLVFDFTLNSGAVPNKVLIAVGTSLGSNQKFIITGISNGLQTHYFSVDSTRADYRFGVRENSATNWSISDLTIEPVTNGNHGTIEGATWTVH
tara:strand:- start:86 stop:1456 length:1371 start_codon:yes stop_codon:yes gene_type:complete